MTSSCRGGTRCPCRKEFNLSARQKYGSECSSVAVGLRALGRVHGRADRFASSKRYGCYVLTPEDPVRSFEPPLSGLFSATLRYVGCSRVSCYWAVAHRPLPIWRFDAPSNQAGKRDVDCPHVDSSGLPAGVGSPPSRDARPTYPVLAGSTDFSSRPNALNSNSIASTLSAPILAIRSSSPLVTSQSEPRVSNPLASRIESIRCPS